LKATQSLGYVRKALELYPDIDVLTTAEVSEAAGGDAMQGIFASGFSESALQETIQAPLEALLDSPLGELLESVLPALPFVLIAAGEGRKVLMGRKSFELALQDGLYRATKTGAAIGVGALVVFFDGGLLSLPAAFLTRLGFDRYRVMDRSVALLEKRIEALRISASKPTVFEREMA
jgi:hypothetical protein